MEVPGAFSGQQNRSVQNLTRNKKAQRESEYGLRSNFAFTQPGSQHCVQLRVRLGGWWDCSETQS